MLRTPERRAAHEREAAAARAALAGKLLRLAAGGALSWLGRLPSGDTGGASVPAEQPMPLPEPPRAAERRGT